MARIAVAALAAGLVALATLTVWGTGATQATTARVRAFNTVSARWNMVFTHLGDEDKALREYLSTRGSLQRSQLVLVTGSANRDFVWLEEHGNRMEVDHVRMLRGQYADYLRVVQSILYLARTPEEFAGYDKLAQLTFVSVRDQVVANNERKQRELAEFLLQVDQRNMTLRWVAVVIVGIDLLLCLASTVVLVAYQRRAEREATSSRYKALHDALTGLANRQLLADRAAAAVAEARRTGGVACLLLIDLDRFKEVNDTLGHHSGDLLLQRVASRLTGASRSTDTVARLGGDEFAVLLPSVDDPEEIPQIAEDLRRAILQPVELNGLMLDFGASVGAAVYPVDADSAEELLQHADVAMYVSKRSGFGVNVYDPRSDAHNPMALSMLSELRYGIGNGELVLHYQPKVDLALRIRGVEVLVRWLHPRRGLIAPDVFLPLIDRTDLIGQLTDEVLRMAVDQASEWASAGRGIPVAVNITARSLLDSAFPARVAELLDRHGVPPRLLTLELTESALITDPDRAADVLRELRVQGIRVSIDDFGTGYSSMALLRDMPVHELKIDRSFVTTMRTDERNHAIVKAIVDLARNLTLDVVAEGVEDKDTLDTLAALGCHYIQGYHISKPLPADVLDTWLDLRPVPECDDAMQSTPALPGS